MQSPYSSNQTPTALLDQITTLFRLDDATAGALRDLTSSLASPDEDTGEYRDFNEEFESVCIFHAECDRQLLFHAYEALYTMVSAKKATDRALKDNNAQVIKTQLEDIQKYAYELEAEPKEMMAATEAQLEALEAYLAKLEEYHRVFSSYDTYDTKN